MSESSCHVRLVFLGSGGVGKTAIIRRFLFKTFNEKHRPTVEDLFFKEFNLGTLLLKVDFLDTAGDLQFPAMRRLSITNAQAFVLVYAINDANSVDIVKSVFEEIREIRPDFQEIPMIFVGNKADTSVDERRVLKEDVAEWVFCELPKLRTRVMECSAKSNSNIRELFVNLLTLARIPMPSDDCGLRRRSSAHASVPKHRPSSVNAINAIVSTVSSVVSSGENSRTTTPTCLSPVTVNCSSPTYLNVSSESRLKPRSRSLIRRTSKKVNKVKDPNSDPEDCIVS